MRKNNFSIIKKITNRSLLSNKKRNYFIIAAIMLTTFMLTSTFSIGMSMFESVHAQRIRMAGSVSHVSYSNPTPEQIDKLSTLDYIETYGTRIFVGTIEDAIQMGSIQLTLVYADEKELEFMLPAWIDVTGNYPQSVDEIMISRYVLEKMGIDTPEIGMKIPLSNLLLNEGVLSGDDIYERTFTLSGFYTDFVRGDQSVLFVSEEFSHQYEKNVQEHGLVNILCNDENEIDYCLNRLIGDLELTSEQQLTMFINPIFNVDNSEQITTIIVFSILIFTFMLTGFLLIYSVLYISVVKDVRFYGILRTIGTTPKQVRHIVVEQVVRLCLVGIPLGILVGILVSFILVPLSVSDSNMQTGIVMSFSPIIYIAAIIFAFLTAIIGAIFPAKKAANLSAIEAVKYTGRVKLKSRTNKRTHGKLYKMALRNIFRERKRTGIVLFNLFFGITTFISVLTIFSSFDAYKFASLEVEDDFVLRNEAFFERVNTEQTFTNNFFEKVNSLPGVNRIDKVTQEVAEIKYTLAFESHVEALIKQGEFLNWTEEEIINNFVGVVTGIDNEALIELNKNLEIPFDLEAFERGEVALIATEEPNVYANVVEIEATLLSSENSFVIPVGGFLPYDFRGRGFNTTPYFTVAPIIFVSNRFLEKFVEDPLISNVHIDVEDGYDRDILLSLREIRRDNNYNFSINSREEARETIREGQMVMYILGGGLSIIISLTGILNFINIISVGIIARKREFATMESIGMTRGQLRKMLIYEGLWYANITFMLVAVVGNSISIGLYKLVERQWSDWLTFNYPLLPVLSIALIILFISGIIPQLCYRSVKKISITDRLREVG